VVEAHLNWIDGERFVVKASSGHAQVIDSDRLRNTAPGPMEMVLMGLCACTATDVVIILKKKREPFAASTCMLKPSARPIRRPFTPASTWCSRLAARFPAKPWKTPCGFQKKNTAQWRPC